MRILILVLALAGTPRARGDAGVDTLVAQALRANRGVQAAHGQARALKARSGGATAWNDPMVLLEFYQTPISTFDPITKGRETDIGVQQEIPFPGKRALMRDAIEQEALAAEHRAGNMERMTRMEMIMLCARLASAADRVVVVHRDAEVLREIISSVRTKVGMGHALQADVLRLEVELSHLLDDSTSLSAERRGAAAAINALRVEPDSAAIPAIHTPDPAAPAASVESLVARATAERPEIKEMGADVEMRRTERAVADREFLPDFMVQRTYKIMRGDEDTWALMLGATLPIAPWSRGRHDQLVEESDIRTRVALDELAETRRNIEREVRERSIELASTLEKYGRHVRIVLPLSEQAYAATLAEYAVDRTTISALLDSYRMLEQMRKEYVEHRADIMMLRAKLEAAVGGTIE